MGSNKNRGPQKTAREDWISAALDILISDGIDNVKVQTIAQNLNCPRSSFYWYFENRSELLDGLLEHWKRTNSQFIISQADLPAPTINAAAIHVFCCWTNDDLFHPALDFAIREWGKRSNEIRKDVEQADIDRVDAITEMFARYGFEGEEAIVRARILYFTQIGYYTLGVKETAETRARYSPQYVYCHTGHFPSQEEMSVLFTALDKSGNG